jgi:hypothetical protein
MSIASSPERISPKRDRKNLRTSWAVMGPSVFNWAGLMNGRNVLELLHVSSSAYWAVEETKEIEHRLDL